MNSPVILITAASSEAEAAKIAETLVDKKLAACASIIPSIKSIYRWKGKVCKEFETMVIAKTVKGLSSEIIKEIQSLHSYELPEIIITDISEGLKDYLTWIQNETKTQ